MKKRSLLALIWDFDGTIADTRERNLDVTRSILKALGKDPDKYDILKDKDLYTHGLLAHSDWRDFYTIELGISQEDTDKMGKMWGEYQLKSDIDQELYPHVDDVIKLAADLPQGIFSINSEHSIRDFLRKNAIAKHIDTVVGYEQLGGADKPDPAGLLKCIHHLGLLMSSGTILYVGDHKTDILAVEAANRLFKGRGDLLHVESIHAPYIYGNNLPEGIKPDYVAKKPWDIITLLISYQLYEVAQDFIEKNS
jgi:HAD superfamily hydrolase (TIGR01549 family)